MVDPITLKTGGFLWKGLAKIPSLTRRVLRWRFPVSRCMELMIIDPDGNSAYFDIQPERPSHSLGGIGLKLHNHLPFDVVVHLNHAVVTVDNILLFDAVMNTEVLIQSSTSVPLALPQLGLSDQQEKWVRSLKREFTRLKVMFDLRCRSDIHCWEDHRSLGYSATINSGNPSVKQEQ